MIRSDMAKSAERLVIVAASVDRSQTRRRGAPAAVAALLMACVLSACSPVEDARVERAESTGSAIEEIQALGAIEAIQTFGQFGLPVWPEILDFESNSGADIRYRMAMRLDDGQLVEFLSQFPLGPQPSDIPRSMPVLAGPALDSAPDPLYLENGIDSTDGAFVREIIIDKRAPNEAYVHISVYTI